MQQTGGISLKTSPLEGCACIRCEKDEESLDMVTTLGERALHLHAMLLTKWHNAIKTSDGHLEEPIEVMLYTKELGMWHIGLEVLLPKGATL